MTRRPLLSRDYRPPGETPDPALRIMDVVVVPRHVIERDGWPQSWTALQALAKVDGQDYTLRRMSLGELVRVSYAPLDLAFFRCGDDDKSCLVAQAWH